MRTLAARLLQSMFTDARSFAALAKDGAGDRDRTGDIQLGKLAFYR
jgi:hypothetical protein